MDSGKCQSWEKGYHFAENLVLALALLGCPLKTLSLNYW